MSNDQEDRTADEIEAYRTWSHDLDALQEVGEEIIATWREQNPHSPRAYPTVRWLTDNGYSQLRWILREKHDMGTREFFVLLTPAGGTEGYEWDIDDVATIERARAYLDDRVECRDWCDETKRTNRSQLNGVLRRFDDQYGDDAVIALANDPAVQPEVYNAFKEVGKSLRETLVSHDSAHHYLRAAHRFFEWLDRSGRIAYDPMDGITDEFRWDLNTESTALTGDQVRRLWVVAETNEERMLVIGYCVWGVRTKELPAVHIDQIKLDDGDPYIQFDHLDRKNGQGQVSLILGFDALIRFLETRANDPDWNGYLFPSSDERRSFLSASQARERFKTLCRRADVTVDGDVATPKHGRSFYYNILADAETDLLEVAGKIAQEQGSADAKSVRDFYLTPERRRRYRRIFFQERLMEILPNDAYTPDYKSTDYNTELADFR